MDESGTAEFPGFQICVHKDELVVFRRPLSRLQRRAPRPLQVKKPNPSSLNSKVAASHSQAIMECSLNQSWTAAAAAAGATSSSSSSYNSLIYQSKDPIPLLSPLVLPLLESSYLHQAGNTAP